ncbi:hypothetical protein WJM97_15170 [Okeanomitos corallinicola TIOX110]|uniref:Uncharacterized protein n=1 Tax=Okeanomitos corallinicola TIOX110 TaxID=3133117 RepID=A0ABZ2UTI6_9CYAN
MQIDQLKTKIIKPIFIIISGLAITQRIGCTRLNSNHNQVNAQTTNKPASCIKKKNNKTNDQKSLNYPLGGNWQQITDG